MNQRSTLLTAIVAVAAVSLAAPAHAQDLAGKWRQTSQSMTFEVAAWGPACGPKPRDMRRKTSKVFDVTQAGDKVAFKKGRRKLGTHRCLSENPDLEFRSFDPSSRTTKCSTSPENSRSESGRYVLKIVDLNTLRYTGKTRYDWSLKGTHCKASMKEAYSFTRVDPVAPPPEPVAAPEPVVEEPVAEAPIEDAPVRVRRRRRSSGDSEGGIILDLEGRSGPGGAGGLGGLADERHQVGTAASRRGATLAVGIVLATFAISLFAAAFLLISRKRRRVRAATGRGGGGRGGEGGSSGGAAPGGGGAGRDQVDSGAARMACPRCQRDYGARERFCPFDAQELEEIGSGRRGDYVPLTRMICRTCQREYQVGTDRCPEDGTELLPLMGRRGPSGVAPVFTAGRAKICPSCTATYAREVSYCGKDGSELVVVN